MALVAYELGFAALDRPHPESTWAIAAFGAGLFLFPVSGRIIHLAMPVDRPWRFTLVGTIVGVATGIIEAASLEQQFGDVFFFSRHFSPSYSLWFSVLGVALPVCGFLLVLFWRRPGPGGAPVQPGQRIAWLSAFGASQLVYGPTFFVIARLAGSAGIGFWVLWFGILAAVLAAILGLARHWRSGWIFPSMTVLLAWPIAHLMTLEAFILIRFPAMHRAAENAPRGIPGAGLVAVLAALVVASITCRRAGLARRQRHR